MNKTKRSREVKVEQASIVMGLMERRKMMNLRVRGIAMILGLGCWTQEWEDGLLETKRSRYILVIQHITTH